MEFEGAVFIPLLEQNFDFESEKEKIGTGVLKKFRAWKDTPACFNVLVWTLQQTAFSSYRYTCAFCIPSL